MLRLKAPGVECASLDACPFAEVSPQGALVSHAPYFATSGIALSTAEVLKRTCYPASTNEGVLKLLTPNVDCSLVVGALDLECLLQSTERCIAISQAHLRIHGPYYIARK